MKGIGSFAAACCFDRRDPQRQEELVARPLAHARHRAFRTVAADAHQRGVGAVAVGDVEPHDRVVPRPRQRGEDLAAAGDERVLVLGPVALDRPLHHRLGRGQAQPALQVDGRGLGGVPRLLGRPGHALAPGERVQREPRRRFRAGRPPGPPATERASSASSAASSATAASGAVAAASRRASGSPSPSAASARARRRSSSSPASAGVPRPPPRSTRTSASGASPWELLNTVAGVAGRAERPSRVLLRAAAAEWAAAARARAAAPSRAGASRDTSSLTVAVRVPRGVQARPVRAERLHQPRQRATERLVVAADAFEAPRGLDRAGEPLPDLLPRRERRLRLRPSGVGGQSELGHRLRPFGAPARGHRPARPRPLPACPGARLSSSSSLRVAACRASQARCAPSIRCRARRARSAKGTAGSTAGPSMAAAPRKGRAGALRRGRRFLDFRARLPRRGKEAKRLVLPGEPGPHPRDRIGRYPASGPEVSPAGLGVVERAPGLVLAPPRPSPAPPAAAPPGR